MLEFEGTSCVPSISGKYILEETANELYVQSKARDTFNDSSLPLVITRELEHRKLIVRKWIAAIKHVDQNKDSDAITYSLLTKMRTETKTVPSTWYIFDVSTSHHINLPP